MDTGTIGAISTVLVTIAFFAICFWAFSPKLKERFEEDAKLPFADEDKIENKQAEDNQQKSNDVKDQQ